MKKIAKTTGTIGTAAALSLGLGGCSSTPPAPPVVPQGTSTSGGSEAEPNAAPEQPGASSEPTDSPKAPDCRGKDQFTEACGYASPTKYAALDPTGIRNS
jgi:hypothetical protein